MNTNDSRSDWAEQMDSFSADAQLTSGAIAAAEGRALLEAALGGPQEVAKALRGRRSLSGTKKRGYRSPTRSFRLTEELDTKLTTVVTTQQRPQSEIVREALSEYFKHHHV